MNITIIKGRLTDNAKINTKPDEKPTETARFSLAVQDLNRIEDGKHPVDYIKIVAYNGIAKNVERYTKKGSEITVIGRMHTYSYKNKSNQTVYMSEVIADKIEFGADCIMKSDIAATSNETTSDAAATN